MFEEDEEEGVYCCRRHCFINLKHLIDFFLRRARAAERTRARKRISMACACVCVCVYARAVTEKEKP